MQELKPVAWMSTDCIGERYLCFSRPNDDDKCEDLYAIPATHRIVPVELLKRIEWVLKKSLYWSNNELGRELCTIIDKEPTT